MSDTLTLGDLIRTRREALGLSARQLQDGIGCSRVTVWHYETGKRRPLGDDLAAVLRALQIEQGTPDHDLACRLAALGPAGGHGADAGVDGVDDPSSGADDAATRPDARESA